MRGIVLLHHIRNGAMLSSTQVSFMWNNAISTQMAFKAHKEFGVLASLLKFSGNNVNTDKYRLW